MLMFDIDDVDDVEDVDKVDIILMLETKCTVHSSQLLCRDNNHSDFYRYSYFPCFRSLNILNGNAYFISDHLDVMLMLMLILILMLMLMLGPPSTTLVTSSGLR